MVLIGLLFVTAVNPWVFIPSIVAGLVLRGLQWVMLAAVAIGIMREAVLTVMDNQHYFGVFGAVTAIIAAFVIAAVIFSIKSLTIRPA